ncbi:hypothetical protein H9L15_07855 [Sphingomonas daechungensis]|uniref:Transglutaminase-like domain-containing protein n=1 Tax=Sphingomonas daechungensis TaxID=1176646 RepID=A0ABX6SXU0_9SPHN|nr:transglutaminase domain-containing protein [Sphingomonas daechungensis]QNP42280.1 hypothetical protein H9L15_07855 [Sphingomonas daechungensis]
MGFGGAVFGAAIAVLWYQQVPARPTSNDLTAVRQLLPEHVPLERTFDEQVAFILRVQNRVLAASPEERGIPLGRSREIVDLLRAGHGACFDRSRAIETALKANGFRTRHASMYSTAKSGSALRSLLTPDTTSHALTEVETSRGWMIVDSKTHWAGLTADGRPVDLEAVRANPKLRWSSAVKDPLPEIYGGPLTWVYGLYSRHGRFYPPYDPVPDVNWGELAQNLNI